MDWFEAALRRIDANLDRAEYVARDLANLPLERCCRRDVGAGRPKPPPAIPPAGAANETDAPQATNWESSDPLPPRPERS